MSDEFDCPGCSAHLTKRQLRMTSTVKESCPRCGITLNEGDAFHYENTDAIIAEDVDGIATWLASEKPVLGFDYEQIRDREAQGEYRWQATGAPLAGCPDNWVIEVFYTSRSPGTMAVRVTAVEPEEMDDEIFQPLIPVWHDHGLQAHGNRTSGIGLSGSHVETRWGGQQYLNTQFLAVGLLKPVLKRLLGAMRDALTMRNRGGDVK
jgi:hypothetical protein